MADVILVTMVTRVYMMLSNDKSRITPHVPASTHNARRARILEERALCGNETNSLLLILPLFPGLDIECRNRARKSLIPQIPIDEIDEEMIGFFSFFDLEWA